MSNSKLYFIPILMKALEKEEIQSSVESAISETTELGKLEENKTGYEQFEMFLKAGINESNSYNYIDRIFHGIINDYISITEIEKDDLLQKINSNPELKKRYQEIITNFGHAESIKLEIYKDGKLLKNISLEDDKSEVSKIEVGEYTISLNNGRVLWVGEITDQDIMLDPIKNTDYKMAASTEDKVSETTKTIKLMNNELTLFVYAGLEYGKLKFVLNEK